jgi:hypothetical protein
MGRISPGLGDASVSVKFLTTSFHTLDLSSFGGGTGLESSGSTKGSDFTGGIIGLMSELTCEKGTGVCTDAGGPDASCFGNTSCDLRLSGFSCFGRLVDDVAVVGRFG